MAKNINKIVNSILLVIIIIAAVGAVVIWFVTNRSVDTTISENDTVLKTDTKRDCGTAILYENTQAGFSLCLPADWEGDYRVEDTSINATTYADLGISLQMNKLISGSTERYGELWYIGKVSKTNYDEWIAGDDSADEPFGDRFRGTVIKTTAEAVYFWLLLNVDNPYDCTGCDVKLKDRFYEMAADRDVIMQSLEIL